MALNFNPSDYDEVMDEILRQIDLDRFTVGGGGIVGEKLSPALVDVGMMEELGEDLFKDPSSRLQAKSNLDFNVRGRPPGPERRVARKSLLHAIALGGKRARFADWYRKNLSGLSETELMKHAHLDALTGEKEMRTHKKLMDAFKKLGKSRGVAPLLMLALLGGGAAALGE
tara:strand:- start:257 stop:769 length:513 start_codon:yes stop_codon:yes gene_type:complete